jgi:hypothetical protein
MADIPLRIALDPIAQPRGGRVTLTPGPQAWMPPGLPAGIINGLCTIAWYWPYDGTPLPPARDTRAGH